MLPQKKIETKLEKKNKICTKNDDLPNYMLYSVGTLAQKCPARREKQYEWSEDYIRIV